VSGYGTATSTSVSQTDSSETQDVTCGTKNVLGGGYVIGTSDAGDAGKVFATASFPLNANTWRINAQVVAGAVLTVGETWTVTAWATCATVAN
jgi:hypothetical protein